VALTYQRGAFMTLYLNGRSAGSQAVDDQPIAVNEAPLSMAVDGAIDDMRVYGRALSPGAVAVLAGGRSCVATGATWNDAMPDLQCALLESEAGAEVWVGPGIYRPTSGPDRTATFAIGDGIGVYGGFAGTESSRAERMAQTPRPVLSGDIGLDDRVDAGGVLTDPAGLVGGNALHVVTISSTLTSTVLEELIVTAGQASGADQTGGEAEPAPCGNGCGGGLYVAGGAPRLNGLRVVGNQAAALGGGIYAEQSSTVLISATLQANFAGNGGGGYWRGGAPTLANSLVAGNLAAAEGGGLYGLNSSMRLVNVTVGGNRAGARGGGLLFDGGGSTAANLVVGDNTAPSEAQAGGSGVAVRTSIVQGGCPLGYICGADVAPASPWFVHADPAAAPSSLGNYRLLPFSPAIDTGDNHAILTPNAPEGATIASIGVDLDGKPRVAAARFERAQIDMGAYEVARIHWIYAPITLR
jgi:hypothetical protein